MTDYDPREKFNQPVDAIDVVRPAGRLAIRKNSPVSCRAVSNHLGLSRRRCKPVANRRAKVSGR
jgi:hypothetical protein